MDRFQALQVFHQVASQASFSAAARALNMSAPAVTRIVSQLEEQLQTRLFVRTTRSVRLTDGGQRYLDSSRHILQDMEEAEQAAIGSHINPRGELHITAPVLFGARHVAPLLAGFADLYPDISVKCLFLDRVVNMMEEGVDVAVRIGDLRDSSALATRVGQVRRMVVAAPSWIDAHGIPETPADIAKHQIVQSLAFDSKSSWAFMDGAKEIQVPYVPRFRTNSNDAAIALAREGAGLTRILSYQVADDVAAGRLVPVLEEAELTPWPVHLVHQEGRLVSARTRAFIDYAVPRLRDRLNTA